MSKNPFKRSRASWSKPRSRSPSNVWIVDAVDSEPKLKTKARGSTPSRGDDEDNAIENSRFLRITEAIKLIPEFDGYNMNVNRFVEECTVAVELVNPLDHKHFFVLIRSRLTGDARTRVQCNTTGTLSDLLAELKSMFEPSDRLEQLQSELAHAYQKKGESVNEFGKRLANLVRSASDVIKTSFNDDVTQRNLIQATHKSAIKCYVNGLTENVHHRMVVNINLATLDEAIRAAGEVEADLTIRRSLLLANKDPPTRVHAIASEEKVEAPRLCFKCKQPGHFARACPSGPSGPRDQQRPRYCNTARERATCMYAVGSANKQKI
uniref:CCHC-type domain-containing protein n=1 Tax=Trichogramma kaykai TaxID=54128 RepID=A0ABD2W796_9HYME